MNNVIKLMRSKHILILFLIFFILSTLSSFLWLMSDALKRNFNFTASEVLGADGSVESNQILPKEIYTIAQTKQKIIVLGDSLSAAHGINAQQGWVNILAAYIAEKELDYIVINTSISGETTESGLNRLPSIINNNQPDIDILIIALGANDGLRGLDPSIIKSNLGSMITLCQQNNIRVLLVGMQMPPNYGESYTKAIQNVYRELTIEYKVRQIPFMLANVATKPELMQEDNMHPTEQAQPYIYRNILMGLRPMLLKK